MDAGRGGVAFDNGIHTCSPPIIHMELVIGVEN